MNNFSTIGYISHGKWVEIRLQREKVYNALNAAMLEELLAAFQLASDPGIKCVVLTGEGQAFSSGQDLKAVGSNLHGIPFKEIIVKYYNPLILSMRRLEKPIICKLNGLAVGAGCSLALATDVIIASKDAYMAEIFANIGLVMDAGANYFLPKRVGYPLAFDMASTGRKVYGEEAERIGLVNKSVDADDLDKAVMEYVDIYINASGHAIRLIKEMLNRFEGMELEKVLTLEGEYQEKAGKHQDFREGVMAFLEKRKPKF